MFGSSTKVVVIASSTNKQTSPKYGSAGYIISVGKVQYYMTDGIKIANGIAISMVDMIFTRYGLGKSRSSAERREILCVFPVMREPSEYEKNFTIQDRIERAISKFLKEDFTNNAWYNIKCNHAKNPDYTTVCIMAPTPNYGGDLMTCEEVEFKGWLSSFLLAYPFKTLLSRMCNHIYVNKFPFGADHREMLMILNEATKSKSYRREFLNKSVFRSKARRRIAIETVRGVIAIGSSKTDDNDAQTQLRHHMKQGYYFNSVGVIKKEKHLFEMIATGVFKEHTLSWKKNLLFKSKLKNTKLIVGRIEESRDALKCLAQGVTGRV